VEGKLVGKLLEGKLVRLAPYSKDYIPAFLRWFNDPEVTQYLIMHVPLTLEQENEFYDKLVKAHDGVNYVILDLARGSVIGNLGADLNWKDRVATFGIMIGEKEFWGKGFGTDATRLFVNYLFAVLNMHRIELTCFNRNTRAKKCYEKVGFIEEGIKRKAKFGWGEMQDVVVMGILRNEWKE